MGTIMIIIRAQQLFVVKVFVVGFVGVELVGIIDERMVGMFVLLSLGVVGLSLREVVLILGGQC
jgi:hypothetical protein